MSCSYAANLQNLILDEAACVKEVIGEKLYFHEKAIHPSSDGIYIELNNDANFMLVPELSFDGQGYFLNVERIVPTEDSFHRPNLSWTCQT